MTQQLATAAAFPEDLGLIPNQKGQMTAICNSSKSESEPTAPYWPCWAMHVRSTQPSMYVGVGENRFLTLP